MFKPRGDVGPDSCFFFKEKIRSQKICMQNLDLKLTFKLWHFFQHVEIAAECLNYTENEAV